MQRITLTHLCLVAAAVANMTAAVELNGHALRLDSGGEIISWMEPSTAMDRMASVRSDAWGQT